MHGVRLAEKVIYHELHFWHTTKTHGGDDEVVVVAAAVVTCCGCSSCGGRLGVSSTFAASTFFCLKSLLPTRHTKVRLCQAVAPLTSPMDIVTCPWTSPISNVHWLHGHCEAYLML